MQQSPFPYHGPLKAEQVSGREVLAQDLAERIMDRRLTALMGPRRYGKTSLLQRVAADLAAVGPQPIWIDLYELNSMADLAGSIDRGLDAVTGSLRRILDSVAGSLSLRLGVVGVELSKEKRLRPDPVLTVRALMQVLVRAAQRQDLLIVFDEFSGISRVSGAAGLLRTELQHHYQDLGIVFAGSQPSTMRTLFSDQAQPFFAQADLIEIGPLEDHAVENIVEEGFEATGRAAGEATSRIVGFADGHPQRAMQLADATWRLTDPGGKATEATWEEGLAEVRANVDAASERMFAMLAPGHQKTLRVLAAEGSVYGNAAGVLELSPGTARAAVEALTGNGFIVKRNGRVALVDPLLADWLQRRFTL